jgi:hypothetical protein
MARRTAQWLFLLVVALSSAHLEPASARSTTTSNQIVWNAGEQRNVESNRDVSHVWSGGAVQQAGRRAPLASADPYRRELYQRPPPLSLSSLQP